VDPKDYHSAFARNPFEILQIADVQSYPTKSNFLKVRALLKRIDFVLECDHDDRWVYGTRGTFPYDFYVSCQSPTGNDTEESGGPRVLIRDRQVAIKNGQSVKIAEGRLDLDDKDKLTRSERELFYIHINQKRRPSGLIVEPTETGKSTFKRVGVATIFSKENELFLQSCFGEEDVAAEATIF
jgi:hypothetical protein